MDAIFINGPFLTGFSRESRSPAVTKSGTLYYPAWLAYACGHAENQGFECKLIDSIADRIGFDESVNVVSANLPKVVFIGTSTPSIDADAKFAKALKEKIDGVVICLVGTHASATPDETLNKYEWVDVIARREYDLTASELIQCIRKEEDWSHIDGISFKKKSEIAHNPDREYIDNLDYLPFVSEVYKKHLTIENYYYGHVKFPMVSIFTSRGCNAKCTYCVYPQTMFGNFRSRTPENIAEEFKWIADNLPHVKEILVDDDTFTMFSEHAEAVAAALIKMGNKIPWTCEVRANLKYKTLKLMKEAGCRLVVVGFESIEQKVLNNIKKGTKQSIVENFTIDAKKAKVKIHACFMAGNPGDNIETLTKSLDWAIKKKFDTAQFFPVQLYPGTTAYDEAKKEGWLKPQEYRMWVTETGMHNMTLNQNDEGMTEQQVLDFCDYSRRKFYLRPGYIIRKSLDIFLDFDEFKKNVKGFMSLRKYLFKNISRETS